MKRPSLIQTLSVVGLLLLSAILGDPVRAQETPQGQLHPTTPSVTAQNWLHFGCDDAYTAHNTTENTLDPTNIAQLERRWGIGCDDGYFSVISRSPAIYGGTLFTSGAGSRLTAYEATSGRKLWEFGSGNLGWAPQPVVSEDGIVFYMEGTSGYYDLYAVNHDDGSKLWQAPLAFEMGFNERALVTVDEAKGLVYLVENPFMGNGKLYALNKATGEVAWFKSKATDNVEFMGDYPLLSNGKLYVPADAPMAGYPDHGDHLLRLDTTTHAIEMQYQRPKPEGYYGIAQYVLCNERLVAAFDYQYNPIKLLVGYDPASPTISWQKPISATTGTLACNTASGLLYVPTDPHLLALDAATGAEVWRYTSFAAIRNPSIANGIIYFLAGTNMYAIDETTHRQLFRYPLGYSAQATSQVAIAAGMAFFSGNGGTCDLFALGLPGRKLFLPLLNR